MSIPNVLFIGQKHGFNKTKDKLFCGIGIRGKLTTDILVKSTKYNFIPCWCDSYVELDNFVKLYNPVVMIYNYHPGAFNWIIRDDTPVSRYPNIPSILIDVDASQDTIDTFTRNPIYSNYMLTDNITLTGTDRFFIVPRSTPEYTNTHYVEHDVPRIGYQGFAADHKGIIRLANIIKNEFTEAVFRLHIPHMFVLGSLAESHSQKYVDQVREILKDSNIQIEVSHDFKSDSDIVTWLSENSINCYLYDIQQWAGPASSPDYAIAAKRPIAVSSNHMLSNIWTLAPSTLIDSTSLKQLISNGIGPLHKIYEIHNPQNVLSSYEEICNRITNKLPQYPPSITHISAKPILSTPTIRRYKIPSISISLQS